MELRTLHSYGVVLRRVRPGSGDSHDESWMLVEALTMGEAAGIGELRAAPGWRVSSVSELEL